MAEHRPHARWTDAALGPVEVEGSGTYPGVAAGPVRRAELYDQSGMLLGHVWTDDQAAAGFEESPGAGPAGIRAGAEIWRILADAYEVGIPAADLLDPDLYEPEFQLMIRPGQGSS